MSAIFLLVGVSLVVAIGFLIAFIWSVKDGQYDDAYTPSIRMLFDNTLSKKNEKTDHSTSENKPNKNQSIHKKQR